MRRIFRTIITIIAALSLVFSGVAFAQEDDPVAQRAECEAAGGVWSVGRDEFLAPVYHCDPPDQVASETADEQAPAEPAPSAELPATQPAAAQPGAPQYTG